MAGAMTDLARAITVAAGVTLCVCLGSTVVRYDVTGHVMSLVRVIGRGKSYVTRNSLVRRSRRVIALTSGHATGSLEREAQGQQHGQQGTEESHSGSLNRNRQGVQRRSRLTAVARPPPSG